jgi:hypothetical protein
MKMNSPFRPNWRRPCRVRFFISDVMTLKTLADVPILIGHLPADRR